MTIFYDFSSSCFSRSYGHKPQQWEFAYLFEEAQCWNCGGEFLLERRNPQGYFEYKQCWTCNYTGTLQTSVETVTFDPNWYEFAQFYNIFFINGAANEWEVL